MHRHYVHVCQSCGAEIQTSGLWEFYRDAKGNFKNYGHPVPESIEAEESGIYGLYGHYYCLDCHENTPSIVLESKVPVFEKTAIWQVKLDLLPPYGHHYRPGCIHCGSEKLLLAPRPHILCPRCQKGFLKGREKNVSI